MTYSTAPSMRWCCHRRKRLVGGLIDAIEDLDDPNLTVEFNPEGDSCIVKILATKVTCASAPAPCELKCALR